MVHILLGRAVEPEISSESKATCDIFHMAVLPLAPSIYIQVAHRKVSTRLTIYCSRIFFLNILNSTSVAFFSLVQLWVYASRHRLLDCPLLLQLTLHCDIKCSDSLAGQLLTSFLWRLHFELNHFDFALQRVVTLLLPFLFVALAANSKCEDCFRPNDVWKGTRIEIDICASYRSPR